MRTILILICCLSISASLPPLPKKKVKKLYSPKYQEQVKSLTPVRSFKLEVSNLKPPCFYLGPWKLPALVHGQEPAYRLWSVWYSTNLVDWMPYAPDAAVLTNCLERTNPSTFYRLKDEGPRN